MRKIEQLKAVPVIGNARDDSGRFKLAHEILTSPDESKEDKYEALREIDRTTGEFTPEPVDDEDVDLYLKYAVYEGQ